MEGNELYSAFKIFFKHIYSLHEITLLPLWKAAVSVCLLVPKQERNAFMLRLTGENLTVLKGLTNKPDQSEDIINS